MQRVYEDKRLALIRLVRRVCIVDCLTSSVLGWSISGFIALTVSTMSVSANTVRSLFLSSQDTPTAAADIQDPKSSSDGDRSRPSLRLELGEFRLPLLVLSTAASSHMLMETDGRNSEMYIKINQTYSLRSSDSVLTELAYDDINRFEPSNANALLQVIIRS